MKNYSFSNIANQESYATRKNNDFNNYYRHSQLKSSEANQKIEQIKKKYDTPSRRERLESLKKSKDYDTASRLAHKQQIKQNVYEHKIVPSFGNSYLKESVSINRLDKSVLRDQENKQYATGKFQPRDHRRSYQFRQPQPLSLKNMNLRQSEPISLKNLSMKEEQECIFMKMRQMKESLVNNDYMKRSSNIGKSNTNISKYNQEDSKTGNKKQKQYDPRVQNIDKINSKIKQILSCLSENEKQQSYNNQSKESYSKETKQTYMNPSRQSYGKEAKETYTNPSRQSYGKEAKEAYNYPSRQSYSREPTFNYEISNAKQSGKSSAFFGINNVNFKEISQSKKSYESHFHRGSDVLQKIDVYDPTGRQGPKTDKVQERLSKNQNYSVSKSIIDYQPPRNRDYLVNRVDTQKSYYAQKQADITKTPNPYASREFSQMKGLKVSQSKSHIDSIKKSALTANDSHNGLLKSGKKLNEQINRIQKKIEDFEREKTKLNIEFTPFSSKNKSQSNLNISVKQKKFSEYPQDYKAEKQQHRTLQRNNAINRSSSYDIKLKSYMNRASVYEQRINELKISTKFDKEVTSYQPNGATNHKTKAQANNKSFVNDRSNQPRRQQSSDIQLKLQQIQVKTVRIQKQIQMNEQNSFNQLQSKRFTQNINYQDNSSASRIKSQRQSDINEQFIKKRTDQGMQERKKRLQSTQSIIKTQTIKKMVALFCQQVKYDEDFRNLKIWLQGCLNKDKFDRLSRLLEKEGIQLTIQQCQTLFSLDESENNPFFSSQGFEANYQELIKSYIESQNHWVNQICHKFDKRALVIEGFTAQRIDLQRKGYIELEDLVRFLNIESGTFYRNRDLFLIFHRFTNTQKMNFEKIIEQISA